MTDRHLPEPDSTATPTLAGVSLKRRDLFKLMAAALVLGPWLPGCRRPEGELAADVPETVFDVLRGVRDALRTSPDHLPAQLQRRVAGGDWRSIFGFVRDQIETWPTRHDSFLGDNAHDVRWGTAATLRGGAGTPREKADLLASALAEAGFSAQVVNLPLIYTPEDVQRILQPRQRALDPEVDPAALARWKALLNQPGDRPLPEPVDPDDAIREALVSRLLGVIEELPRPWPGARGFDLRWRNGVAVVVVDTPEGRLLLNPTDPAAQPEVDPPELKPVGGATGLITVEASLEVTTTDEPGERKRLVTGEWDAAQLVGRTLVVATPPAVAPEDWAGTRIDDVQTFVPVLRVVDGGRDASLAELGVAGEPFTRRAETITVGADGGLRVGESSLAVASEGAMARVQAISAQPLSLSRGEAVIAAEITDAAGVSVEGLGADALAVTVAGEPRGFLLVANRPELIVTLLIDQSLSMPGEYLNEQGEAWLEQTRAQVLAVAPRAVVRVEKTGSHLWKSLSKESARGGDLLVYLTDGDMTDRPTDALRATLASGPPALLISVKDRISSRQEELAAAANGRVVPVADKDAAAAAITEALVGQKPLTYRLRLATTGLAAGDHPATLATRDGRVSGAFTLSLDEANTTLPSQICGLYLKLRVGDVRIERTLGGLDHRLGGRVEPGPHHLDEAGAALLAGASIAFEGAAPGISTWLDDLISSRLPLEQVLAVDQDEGAAAGFNRLVAEFQPLAALAWQAGLLPLDHDRGDALTYHHGLRAVLMSLSFDRDAKQTSRIDILPVSRFASAIADGSAACVATLRQTARLAVAEAAHFDTSTLGLLEGQSLGLLGRRDEALRALPEPARTRWNRALSVSGNTHVIGGKSFESFAWYQVSRDTGELLAILPDGSGGGSDVQDMVAFVDNLKTVMDLYEAATWTPAGAVAGAPGLSSVAGWNMVLVRLYAAAAVTVRMLGEDTHDEQSRRIIQKLACDAAKMVGGIGFGGEQIKSSVRELVAVLTGGPGKC